MSAEHLDRILTAWGSTDGYEISPEMNDALVRAAVALRHSSIRVEEPARPAHDHDWDAGCTINCPWRRHLIADVLASSDPSEPYEIPDNETEGQMADRLAEMQEDEPNV